MGILLVAPGRAMDVGFGRAALARSLQDDPAASSNGIFRGPLPNAIADLSGWWDAGNVGTARGPESGAVASWNDPAASLCDKSGHGTPLTPYSFSPAAG